MDNFQKKVSGVCVGASNTAVYIVNSGKLLKMTPDLSSIQVSISLPAPLMDREYSVSRIVCRVLRRGVISGCLGIKTLMIWTRRALFFFDSVTLDYLGKHTLADLGRPLHVNACRENEKDVFYFGEYLSNPSRRAVAIVRCCASSLTKVGEIPAGHIEHVHNIVQENDHNMLILAGDFDVAASIWRFNKSSAQVKCLVQGDQNFRTSAAIIDNGHIIYATDTSSKVNSFRRLNLKTLESEELQSLPASSIYSASAGKYMAFSTNIEAALETKFSPVKKWTTRKIPDVFSTRDVHLFVWKNGKLEEVFCAKPSHLPYRLFQYPTFRIHVSDNNIYASGVSVRGLDQKVIRLSV